MSFAGGQERVSCGYGRSRVWGSESKSQGTDWHISTSQREVLSASLLCVGDGETKLVKIDVVPGGMFTLVSIWYSNV